MMNRRIGNLLFVKKNARQSVKFHLIKCTNRLKGQIRKKSLKIPKGGNQDPYIEEEQTTQSAKGQTTI